MREPNFGWDLPPGVSQRMIEDAQGQDPNEETEEDRECEGCGWKGRTTVYRWVDREDDPDTGESVRVVHTEQWECPDCDKEYDATP